MDSPGQVLAIRTLTMSCCTFKFSTAGRVASLLVEHTATGCDDTHWLKWLLKRAIEHIHGKGEGLKAAISHKMGSPWIGITYCSALNMSR